jgi:DNA-binding MarR family transcriptional regulator
MEATEKKNIGEVAERAGVSRRSVENWVKKGWIKSRRNPKDRREILIDLDDLARFVGNNKQPEPTMVRTFRQDAEAIFANGKRIFQKWNEYMNIFGAKDELPINIKTGLEILREKTEHERELYGLVKSGEQLLSKDLPPYSHMEVKKILEVAQGGYERERAQVTNIVRGLEKAIDKRDFEDRNDN